MATSVLPPFPVNVKTAPPVSVTATIDGSTMGIAAVGTVYNVAMPSSNTEYSFVIPDGSKGFELKPRGNSSLKLAFTSGQSGTSYIEVSRGDAYEKTALNTLALALYFQTPTAPEVAQIIIYS